MSERERIRALLVEDDDEDAAIFQRYLAGVAGYAVRLLRATTRDEALSVVSEQPLDLIFLDMNLALGDSGLTVLQRLQEGGAAVPVVFVTGTGDELKAVEAMKGGAYDYLVKDALSTDLLERTVRNVRARHLLEQERLRMVEKLEELSVTDELTGLANRRRLDSRLDEEVKRSERTGHIFSLLMIDLDHFKKVNDRYGHQVGDQVLRDCAAALQGELRVTDLIARYGGEEFCVILPETPATGARQAAERLRRAAAALPAPVPTVSVGVASWQPGIKPNELLHSADDALYRAKDAGRNRVVVAGDEGALGARATADSRSETRNG